MGAGPDETSQASKNKRRRGGLAPLVLTPDPAILTELLSMGFSINAATRSAIGVNNHGVQEAVEWCFKHMEDADFNDPLPAAEPLPEPGPEREGPAPPGVYSASQPSPVSSPSPASPFVLLAYRGFTVVLGPVQPQCFV